MLLVIYACRRPTLAWNVPDLSSVALSTANQFIQSTWNHGIF